VFGHGTQRYAPAAVLSIKLWRTLASVWRKIFEELANHVRTQRIEE